jgi:single-stranded DNA-binding protein
MTSFSLAVYQGRDKPSMWLHVKCFDQAVTASKGQKVRVTGRLYFETYQAKDGAHKTVWGVIADTVEPVEREEKQHRPANLPPLDEDCPF